MLYCYFLILQCYFLCISLSRFVMLYCYFIHYNVVLCLVIIFCDDVTLFYRLQYITKHRRSKSALSTNSFFYIREITILQKLDKKNWSTYVHYQTSVNGHHELPSKPPLTWWDIGTTQKWWNSYFGKSKRHTQSTLS